MKERPILFFSPMVLAILERRKTMTRRVVKSDINLLHARGNPVRLFADWPLSKLRTFDPITATAEFDVQCDVDDYYTEKVKCSYGIPGDRLWVRETHAWFDTGDDSGWIYRATDPDWETTEGWKWKPSIFMPRAASRILLEITDVHVERLLEITDEDAIREGVEQWPDGNWKAYGKHAGKYTHARDSFLSLWEAIDSPWALNPWVWAIEFKILQPEL